jgi:hypothetical protein
MLHQKLLIKNIFIQNSTIEAAGKGSAGRVAVCSLLF